MSAFCSLKAVWGVISASNNVFSHTLIYSVELFLNFLSCFFAVASCSYNVLVKTFSIYSLFFLKTGIQCQTSEKELSLFCIFSNVDGEWTCDYISHKSFNIYLFWDGEIFCTSSISVWYVFLHLKPYQSRVFVVQQNTYAPILLTVFVNRSFMIRKIRKVPGVNISTSGCIRWQNTLNLL